VDLSGRWTGVYFYPVDAELNPDDDMPPTPFEALLEDADGLVTGRTTEPDYLSGRDAPAVTATLEGHHDQGVLTFTKSPEGALHTIDYVGRISNDGNTIAGDWFIHGDWSGRFRMDRSTTQQEMALNREAAV